MGFGQRQVCCHCTIPLLLCLCYTQVLRKNLFLLVSSGISRLVFKESYEVRNGSIKIIVAYQPIEIRDKSESSVEQ